MARYRAERARLAEAVQLDRRALAALAAAGTIRVYSRETVAVGDAVKAHGRWHRVARVNAKSVSVETGYSWTDTVPYHTITGHRAAAPVDAPSVAQDEPPTVEDAPTMAPSDDAELVLF